MELQPKNLLCDVTAQLALHSLCIHLPSYRMSTMYALTTHTSIYQIQIQIQLQAKSRQKNKSDKCVTLGGRTGLPALLEILFGSFREGRTVGILPISLACG